jgi:polysaccharide biosynthesis protein PslH
MRTLFITMRDLYPPAGGAALRNWQNINCVKQYSDVGVFYLHVQANAAGEVAIQKPPGIDFWEVFSLPVRPQLQRSLGQLKSLLWALTGVYSASADGYYHPGAIVLLDQVLQTYQPDVVVFEELWMYAYLPVVQRYPCKIVYDAHNVEAELMQQIADGEATTNKRFALELKLRAKLVAKMERKMMSSCHQLWACSDGDRLKLGRSLPQKVSGFTISNGVNLQSYDTRLAAENSPPLLNLSPYTVIFTASFSYAPNVRAAHWLIEDIYPQLQALYPDCNLLLVGSNPPHSLVKAVQANASIILTGRVPDVCPYLAAASVVVVPLLEGGGTRLKILEAFAAMRPVVSTAKGAEGLAVEDGKELLIRDTSWDIVQGIHDLWRSPESAQALVADARILVESFYSWQSAEKAFQDAIQDLKPNSAAPPGLFHKDYINLRDHPH